MKYQITGKTEAVLISAGYVVAQCETAAKGGDQVAYGFHQTKDGSLLQIGWAKISRDKRYMTPERLHGLPVAYVNYGGGETI